MTLTTTVKSLNLRPVPTLRMIALLLFVVPLFGVIWRHDVEEKEYCELAKEDLFLPVGAVYCRGLNSTGTLISPTTVLVSAHAISPDTPAIFQIYSPNKGEYIKVRGVTKQHEHFFRKHNEDRRIISLHNDIGVITLEEAIEDIQPAKCFFNPVELGTLCYGCGFGRPGTGLSGPQGRDQIKRGFTNTIDNMIDDPNFDPFYTIFFDSPDDSPNATPFEGIGSEGDSGAPIFIERGGEFLLVGVLNLLILKGFYASTNTILPLMNFKEWIEKNS